jgi:hypothetical protein
MAGVWWVCGGDQHEDIYRKASTALSTVLNEALTLQTAADAAVAEVDDREPMGTRPAAWIH